MFRSEAHYPILSRRMRRGRLTLRTRIQIVPQGFSQEIQRQHCE
jgi:hypothetical protein